MHLRADRQANLSRRKSILFEEDCAQSVSRVLNEEFYGDQESADQRVGGLTGHLLALHVSHDLHDSNV